MLPPKRQYPLYVMLHSVVVKIVIPQHRYNVEK
jgi:hypothetical protein